MNYLTNFQVSVQCWCSAGTVLVKCWYSAGSMLVQCCYNVNAVLAGALLVQCWGSTQSRSRNPTLNGWQIGAVRSRRRDQRRGNSTGNAQSFSVIDRVTNTQRFIDPTVPHVSPRIKGHLSVSMVVCL